MKANLKIVILISILSVNISANGQIKVKADGKVRIGSGTINPMSILEVQECGKTTELRVFATSPNNARIWTANSTYAYAFGVDDRGIGHLYKNMNMPSTIMTFNSNGYFGIGRAPSYTLDVNGNIRVNTTIYTSDERIKTNVTPITNQIDNLFKLKNVSYVLNVDMLNSDSNVVETETMNSNKIISKLNGKDNRVHYGFIAQDIKNFYPELVYEDKDGILGIDYVSFIPLIVAELKRQKEIINNLAQEIEELKVMKVSEENNCTYQSLIELSHNHPKMVNEKTAIIFKMPREVLTASIYIYDLNGNKIKSCSITNNNLHLEIKELGLTPGKYVCAVIANESLMDLISFILTE